MNFSIPKKSISLTINIKERYDATDFKEYRIKVFDEGDAQNLKSIDKINEEVDDFIKVYTKKNKK